MVDPVPTVPRPIAGAVNCKLAIAARSAPAEPDVVKSAPDSRSDHTVLAMPALEASAGGVTDHPDVVPVAKELVAVNVAPPAPCTLDRDVQSTEHEPDGHDRDAVVVAPAENDMGLDGVPVHVNGDDTVIVACDVVRSQPAPTLSSLHEIEGNVQFMQHLLVVGLNVILLKVVAPAPKEIVNPIIAEVGARITVFAEFLLKVRLVVFEKFNRLTPFETAPPTVNVPPKLNVLKLALLAATKLVVRSKPLQSQKPAVRLKFELRVAFISRLSCCWTIPAPFIVIEENDLPALVRVDVPLTIVNATVEELAAGVYVIADEKAKSDELIVKVTEALCVIVPAYPVPPVQSNDCTEMLALITEFPVPLLLSKRAASPTPGTLALLPPPDEVAQLVGPVAAHVFDEPPPTQNLEATAYASFR